MTVRLRGPRGLPRIDRPRLLSRSRHLLRELGRTSSELSISLVDDPAIAELNADYRGVEGPTDVLSFSLLEGPHADHRGALLGDVIISLETARGQARRGRRSLDDEVLRLVIHGTLHLLGHDHEEDGEAQVMQREERRLWRALQ